VATVFNLDPERRIVELLQRRDTWSGRTVMWPVMGSDRRVPVDLAALPVYGRDRVFEGFRGFGVLKMGESVADPEALGLTLAPPSAPHGAPAAEEALESPPPALAISATPERRDSDKVIRLAERRAQNEPGGLSPNERTAFQEIAARLKRDQETFADEQPPAEDRQA